MTIDPGPAFVVCSYPEKWNGLYAGLLSIAFELRSSRRSVAFVKSICETLAKMFPGQIVQHFPNDLLMNAIDHDTEDSRRAKSLRMFLAQLARLDAPSMDGAMANDLATSAENHADWIEVVIRPYYEASWSLQPLSDYRKTWETFSENIATYTSGEAGAIADAPPQTPQNTEQPKDSATPTLTENQAQVLKAMAMFDAALLLTAAKIAGETSDANAIPPRAALSPETVRQCVLKLIECNLAERPDGDRLGSRLNVAGRRLAGRIAD